MWAVRVYVIDVERYAGIDLEGRVSPIAGYALIISVVSSAVGAVVLSVLAFRQTLRRPDDDGDSMPRHRSLLRLGHAVAAVCFTVTAVLVLSAIAAPPRPERPGPDQASIEATSLALANVADATVARICSI